MTHILFTLQVNISHNILTLILAQISILDTTADNEFSLESQSDLLFNLEARQTNSQEKQLQLNLLDVSNGAIPKANHKLSKTTNNRKKLGSSRGRPRKTLVAMYHSQISGDKDTIKIRIKKSTAQVIIHIVNIHILRFIDFVLFSTQLIGRGADKRSINLVLIPNLLILKAKRNATK